MTGSRARATSRPARPDAAGAGGGRVLADDGIALAMTRFRPDPAGLEALTAATGLPAARVAAIVAIAPGAQLWKISGQH